jgi:hypothetical protein
MDMFSRLNVTGLLSLLILAVVFKDYIGINEDRGSCHTEIATSFSGRTRNDNRTSLGGLYK